MSHCRRQIMEAVSDCIRGVTSKPAYWEDRGAALQEKSVPVVALEMGSEDVEVIGKSEEYGDRQTRTLEMVLTLIHSSGKEVDSLCVEIEEAMQALETSPRKWRDLQLTSVSPVVAEEGARLFASRQLVYRVQYDVAAQSPSRFL